MKEIDRLAQEYLNTLPYSPVRGDKHFIAGFRKAREMVVAELMSIAAQTDDMGIIYLRDQFLKLGESEAKE